jgi:2-polyprenyl-3-methyl-5-hydroxy-6-metoxy-1,4-benzoquinol methylase
MSEEEPTPAPSRTRSLNSQWEGQPDAYEELRRCWLNERRLRFLAEHLEAAGLPAGSRVLELGCGTGWLVRQLAGRLPHLAFTGLDPDPSYVRFAQEHAAGGNERYVEGTAEALPGAEAGFAVILSNDVLHHVDSLPETFRSAAQAAQPGTEWLAIEPNYLNPYTFARQQFTVDERNFFPRQAVRVGQASGWRLAGRRHLFLIPPFVRTAPSWMIEVERWFERVPVLAGGVCLRFTLAGD